MMAYGWYFSWPINRRCADKSVHMHCGRIRILWNQLVALGCAKADFQLSAKEWSASWHDPGRTIGVKLDDVAKCVLWTRTRRF